MIAADGTISDGVLRGIFKSTRQYAPGVSAPSGFGTSISVNSVREPGANASAMRVTVPAKAWPGISGTRTFAAITRFQTECRVLRDVELNADDVGVHDGEHEGAAGRVRLHQAADIDVALGDDAVERRHHALIVLLLVQHLQLRLLLLDVRLRDRHRRLLRSQGQAIGVALLRGDPSLLDQRLVAPPVGGREIPVGLRLLQRGLQLGHRCFGLGDLVIEFRRSDLGQQLAALDPVADIGVAPRDVAGGARIDVG